MKATAGFPESARSPGVRHRQGFRGAQTEALAGLREESAAGRGWGRVVLHPPGAEGPPGGSLTARGPPTGAGGVMSWANALGLWAERLTA